MTTRTAAAPPLPGAAVMTPDAGDQGAAGPASGLQRRIGSLCTGYGGLDRAVEMVLGGELAWVADNDPGAAAILAHRFPGVPNLGDITETDWAAVEPVDIVTAGFPCQDVSCAGARAGLREGNRSGVWTYVARAIGKLRPSLILLENVGGLLSARADSDVEPCPWCLGDPADQPHMRALGAILGDLATLGFDAIWCCVRASDAGAPHRRERAFILGWAAGDTEDGGWADRRHDRGQQGPASERDEAPGNPGGIDRIPDANADGGGWRAEPGPARRRGSGRLRAAGLRPQPADAEDPDRTASSERREPAPGQAPGRRPRADAGGPGGVLAADPECDGQPGRPQGRTGEADERGEGSRAATAGCGPDAPADANSADPGPDTRGSGETALAGPGERPGRRGEPGPGIGGGAPADADCALGGRHEPGSGPGEVQGTAIPERPQEQPGRLHSGSGDTGTVAVAWGAYGPAIARWERVLGRPAPRPTEPGRTGERLSPRFVEWLMGLPEGWVTDVPGLSRNAQLKALGNGVVPQQAALALSLLLDRVRKDVAA